MSSFEEIKRQAALTMPEGEELSLRADSSVKLVQPSDLEVVSNFIARAAPAHRSQWLSMAVDAILHSPNGLVFGAYSSDVDRRLLAVGTVTASMHDFCHFGFNVLTENSTAASSPEVKLLVRHMLDQAKSLFPIADDQKLLLPSGDMMARRFFVASVGTTHPELFETHGFQTVHSHADQDGHSVHWMMIVSPSHNIEYSSVDFSSHGTPFRPPARLTLVGDRMTLERAAAVIEEEWGRESAEAFMAEYDELQRMPGSAVYALEDAGTVVSVGAIVKALHHDEAWSRAWIVTSRERRGQGFAERLVHGLLEHARTHHPRFSNGPIVMEGHSYRPEYYAKFGSMPVARCTTPTADGRHATWMMRIVPGE